MSIEQLQKKYNYILSYVQQTEEYKELQKIKEKIKILESKNAKKNN